MRFIDFIEKLQREIASAGWKITDYKHHIECGEYTLAFYNSDYNLIFNSSMPELSLHFEAYPEIKEAFFKELREFKSDIRKEREGYAE